MAISKSSSKCKRFKNFKAECYADYSIAYEDLADAAILKNNDETVIMAG
ncbi:hypothetical protein HYU06_02635 [Candidatus Woesearchaeota archaeon]|nr:hypothetical protein [Candidatus Woesearchaeota archaeon]